MDRRKSRSLHPGYPPGRVHPGQGPGWCCDCGAVHRPSAAIHRAAVSTIAVFRAARTIGNFGNSPKTAPKGEMIRGCRFNSVAPEATNPRVGKADGHDKDRSITAEGARIGSLRTGWSGGAPGNGRGAREDGAG